MGFVFNLFSPFLCTLFSNITARGKILFRHTPLLPLLFHCRIAQSFQGHKSHLKPKKTTVAKRCILKATYRENEAP